VPVRDHEGWSAPAQREATTQLQWRLQRVSIRRDVARVGSEFLRELFQARSVSLSTFGGSQYNELVSVGIFPPPSSWYPEETVYPDSVYPRTTQKLRDGGGYFTSDLESPEYVELVGSRNDLDVFSVMGVPMVSAGDFRGEVFIARGHDQMPFDAEDLDISRGLATFLSDALQAATRRARVRAGKSRRGISPSGA
jgi:GAF domain-containing protein